MRPGEPGKGLGGDVTQRDAIADLAEDLAGVAVVIGRAVSNRPGKTMAREVSRLWKA
jgi:hypothetical protein